MPNRLVSSCCPGSAPGGKPASLTTAWLISSSAVTMRKDAERLLLVAGQGACRDHRVLLEFLAGN